MVALFVFSLLTIPVFLVLGLVAQIWRVTWAKRGSEVAVLAGVAALLPVVFERAFEKPVLWPGVVLLAVLLVFGVVMHVRSYRKPS
ncbi:hypothetical protein [Micromonospora haikouensis]|uniref:Uncharacterized protein n=2 Tax=Micromonosporaceae TaxID=28056 RepID=A0A0D0X5S8_9ACTN|nr:hypothetical protein [Micromonospora haikouensis]KIR64860.1 hypothetical protein TK50_04520 [Micromonospora haikouensis]